MLFPPWIRQVVLVSHVSVAVGWMGAVVAFIVLDDDGAVFVPRAQAARVWELAKRIQATEAEQARLARSGQAPLCEQFQVKAFLAARAKEPTLGFRQHLRGIGKAIEE